MSIIRMISRIIELSREGPALPPGIKIGRDVFIDDSAVLDHWHGRHITIDDEATIGPGVRILCHDSSSRRRTGATLVAPVHIGSRAFIGANSLILPGVKIGEDAVVGAGAVVTRDVQKGTVVAGSPAAQIDTTMNLDRKQLAAMTAGAVFNEGLYNRKGLEQSRENELDDAISRYGCYFLSDSQAAIQRNEA